MKITIQHYDEIVSLNVSDQCELHEVRDHLIRILHVMWLPEHVAEIMRVKDWDEGFEAGKEEGYEAGYEHGKEQGNNEGYEAGVDAMRETYEPMLEKAAKDSDRLDWLLAVLGERQKIDNAMTDKEMEEAQ